MVAKKKRSSKRKPKQEEGAHFELNGSVDLVETINGKEVRRTEISGETVLKCLIAILEQGLNERLRL